MRMERYRFFLLAAAGALILSCGEPAPPAGDGGGGSSGEAGRGGGDGTGGAAGGGGRGGMGGVGGTGSACATDHAGGTGGMGDIGGTGGAGGTAGVGGEGGTVEPHPFDPCDSDPTYTCFASCGSDYMAEPICVDDVWVCPSGFIRHVDCPPDVLKCGGPPSAPGDECTAEDGWLCKPSLEDFEACHSSMCTTCNQLEEPVECMGCRCECNGYTVHCTKL